MAITDIITIIISIFSLMRGFSRGFLRSLTGPFSIIVTTAISMLYFQLTQDIIASLIIGTVSPIFLNMLLNFLLSAWIKSNDRDVRPSFLSCSGGAMLTFTWSWIFIFLALVLLSILPPWGNKLTALHSDVTRSASYLIAKPFGNTLFGLPKQAPAAADGSADMDAKSLAQDPRFQNVLKDPEIQDEIKGHEMIKLMNNPKMVKFIQQVMADPAAMKKIMTIYSNQNQPKQNDS